MSQSGERPIRVRSPAGRKVSPARPPPDADDERRALEALERVVRVLADLLGGERLGRLVRGIALLEQRPAARAVVRRLRVLEATLRAVDVAHGSGVDFPARMSVSVATSTCRARSGRPRAAAVRRSRRPGCRSFRAAAALEAERLLLLLELGLQLFQLLVGERAEIREGCPRVAPFVVDRRLIKRTATEPSTSTRGSSNRIPRAAPISCLGRASVREEFPPRGGRRARRHIASATPAQKSQRGQSCVHDHHEREARVQEPRREPCRGC